MGLGRRRCRGDDRAGSAHCGVGGGAQLVWYQYVAFSYGKVDHDRGRLRGGAAAAAHRRAGAHLSDPRRSQAAGFALRAVQLAAIATYFLSGMAKLRFGGLGLGQLRDAAAGRRPAAAPRWRTCSPSCRGCCTACSGC